MVRAILLPVLALAGAVACAVDSAVLIGLRDPDGALRTVIVGKKGVAYFQDERKGELLLPLKEAVQPFRLENGAVLGKTGTSGPLGKVRVAWMSQVHMGLELDVSESGQRPYTKIVRRVVQLSTLKLTKIDDDLNRSNRLQLANAVAEVRRKQPGLQLPEKPDELDWGYARREARWEFVAALTNGRDRVEVVIPDKSPIMNPPTDRSEVSWKSVLRTHPDAIDVVGDQNADFVVVVTPGTMYVHKSGGSALGRELRRVPCKDEVVVSSFWGGPEESEAWLRYLRGEPGGTRPPTGTLRPFNERS